MKKPANANQKRFHWNSGLFATLILLVGQPVFASTSANTQVIDGGSGLVDPTNGAGYTKLVTNAPGGSYSNQTYTPSASGANGGSATSTASTFASEGLLWTSVASSASSVSGPYNGSNSISESIASWSDYLNVRPAGTTVSTGYVTASMLLTNSYSYDLGNNNALSPTVASDFSRISVFNRVQGTGAPISPIDSATGPVCGGWANCSWQQATVGNALAQVPVSFNNFQTVVTLNIPVVFGQNNPLFYQLDSYSLASALSQYGNGITVSSSSAYDELRWGGITGVYDSSGHAITNFTVQSGSGFDYMHASGFVAAVPEPETYAMLLAGLGLVGAAVKRRRTKQA